MKKITLFAVGLTVAAAFPVCAEDAPKAEAPKVVAGKPPREMTTTKINPEAIRKAKYKYTGGKIVKPGSLKGKMVFVNCQKSAPVKWLELDAATFAKFTKLDIGVVDGTFEWPNPKIVGSASLFVVDDEKLPSLVSAPENRWAMVNVAPLRSGAGEKQEFYAARVQKELTRGFALLAGSQDSNYPSSLMGCMTKPEQLDSFVDCRLPNDIMTRIVKYVAGYGVSPAQEVTYRQAVKEGWAPQPTNDVQKAIWEKINAVPDQPIKIKYDPKRDK